MSTVLDPTLRHLNDCGCCEGLSATTPMPIWNRPGLTAIVYRVGTHAQFKQTLLAALSASSQPGLRYLTTRENDDFTIALLDAWAVVAEVLTFYQERIANESYLRTATERRSLLELARLIGYELRPGVAASTYLAFTIEDAPGAPGQQLSSDAISQQSAGPPPVTVAIGTKVQSVPGEGELAQVFETIEKIEARTEWNAIRPRLTHPLLSTDMNSVFIHGITTDLKVGDTSLIVSDTNNRVIKSVKRLSPDEDGQTTRVDFEIPAPMLPDYVRPSGLPQGEVSDFVENTALSETVVQEIISETWRAEDLVALAKIQKWSVEELVSSMAKLTAQPLATNGAGVFVFRQRAKVFGYNAAKQPDYNTDGTPKPPSQWLEWPVDGDEAADTIFLDAAYEAILPGSFVAIQMPGQGPAVYQIETVETRPRTAYGISSETTVLTLAAGQTWWSPPSSGSDITADIRESTIFVQSEQLPLANAPIEDKIAADILTLDRPCLSLRVGQKIILTGELDDPRGVFASEMRMIKEVVVEKGFCVITLNQSLANVYVRKTVKISGNVAEATHGETAQEILGGGDAGQAFQRFSLRQPPLTHVSAATPSGAQSTLEVRVNDVLWHEVPALQGHGPEERIYVTRSDDKGATTVIFGDGQTGARLPTGNENIKVKYRKGIGLAGQVKARQLSQLLSRPLGMKAAINPIEATGAADAEKRDEGRRNAPLTVLTLDRIVSLQDYENFACAFAGIDKALATWTWSGKQRSVFVTVAGSKGAEIKTDSSLYKNLLKAMRQAGDPTVPLQVQSYQPRLFQIAATVQVYADRLPAKVLAAVEQKLRDHFSFDARTFGQPVHLSEVISVINRIPGVVAVDVDKLYRTDQDAELNTHLEAALPRQGGFEVFPAELLMLDSRPIQLGVSDEF